MDYKDLPPTHTEAIRRGEIYYYTGKPCKRGHIGPRFAKGRRCKQCVYERNRERTIKEDYWQDFGDEAYKERKRKYAKKHYLTYAHKKGVQKRRQYEKKCRIATEKGKEEIRRMRLEAQMLTIDTGVKHELDHIIPLVHDLVCGLETPTNCQVLTKAQNRRKASRFDQDKQSRIQMQLLKKRPTGVG